MKDPMEGNLIDPQLMDWSFFSSENRRRHKKKKKRGSCQLVWSSIGILTHTIALNLCCRMSTKKKTFFLFMGIESFLWLAKTFSLLFFFLFASRISQRGAKKTIVEWRDLLKWDQESCRLLFFPYCWIEDKKRIHWSSLLRKLRIDGSLLFVGAVLVSTTWAHRLYVVHLWVGSSRTLYTINKKAHTIFLYHIVCVCFFF